LITDGAFSLLAGDATRRLRALNVLFVVGVSLTASLLTTWAATPRWEPPLPSVQRPR